MSDTPANSSNPYTRMYTSYAALSNGDGRRAEHLRRYRAAIAEINEMTQEERTAALAAYDFELWEDEFQRWQACQSK